MSRGSFFAYCCLNCVNMYYLSKENNHNIDYLNQQVIILKNDHFRRAQFIILENDCAILNIQLLYCDRFFFFYEQTPNTVLFHAGIALHPWWFRNHRRHKAGPVLICAWGHKGHVDELNTTAVSGSERSALGRVVGLVNLCRLFI